MTTVTILPTWYCYRVKGKGGWHYVKAADEATAIKLARVEFKKSVKNPGEIRVRQVIA